MLQEFTNNVLHNLFKPLLLFFYMGFTIPLLGVPFEFPHVIYQGLTMYLLIAIGWHGGEELASLNAAGVQQAAGLHADRLLLELRDRLPLPICSCEWEPSCAKSMPPRSPATTVPIRPARSSLAAACWSRPIRRFAYAAYMPVMLAVMEIPGCLVALFLVSRLRRNGMDPRGNMPGEAGYNPHARCRDDAGSRSRSRRSDTAGNGSHGSDGGTAARKSPCGTRRAMPPARQRWQRRQDQRLRTPSSIGNCCTRCS